MKLERKSASSYADARASIEMRMQVKSYDVDYNRHVHNAVYIRWLEDMRTALLDKYYPLEKFLATGCGPVLVRTLIEYRRAIRLFDPVTARMWVTGSSLVRFELCAVFYVGEALACQAEQTGAIVDVATGRAVRAPVEFVAAFGGS